MSILELKSVRLENVSKYFDGTAAVSGVSFTMEQGKVYSIIGENGAGKSTIVKIMNGTYAPEEGELYVNDNKVSFHSPAEAGSCGIGMVYQELHLIPNLSVTENIFISHLTDSKAGLINWKKLKKKAAEYLDRFGLAIDPDTRVGELKVAHQQIVAIIRAYAMHNRLLILDEPTSALPARDIDIVLDVVRKLIELGCIIVYISHKLDEVLQISDEIIALRNGEKIGEFHSHELDKEKLVELIAGRTLENKFPKKKFELGEELLCFEHVSVPGVLEDISFTLHKGEILGFSGLLGAGKTEIAKTIFGIFGKEYQGSVYFKGERLDTGSPQQVIRKKIGLVPENRATEGLILDQSVRDNVTAASLDKVSSFGWLKNASIIPLVDRLTASLHVKCGSTGEKVRNLSGGNQQKVVLAKWLAAGSDLIIFDEPTRGIDVGAKFEIYNLMNELVEKGIGVIIISSEADEVLGMSDRAVILKNGRITGIVNSEDITEETLLAMC